MTITEAYSKREKTINDLIERLKSNLNTHRNDFNKNPNSWGFIGSLGHVETSLKELLEFFGD